MKLGSTISGGQKKNSSIFNGHKLYTRNYDYFIKLHQTTKNTITLHSDSAWQIRNLTRKAFSMEVFKFLNRNLNFVPTQSKINKKELYNQVEECYIVVLS